MEVPVAELTVDKGVITHAASKRRTTYGRVAAAAAKLPVPDAKAMKLKDPKDWKIAGKPLKRLDTADKLRRAQGLRNRRRASRHAQRRDDERDPRGNRAPGAQPAAEEREAQSVRGGYIGLNASPAGRCRTSRSSRPG